MPRDEIAIIMGEAINAIADLENRPGALQGGMLAIKEAWMEFKNAL